MTVDSPVAATFVAAPDNWSRAGGDVRAVVCHMAEGGGTVPWLQRNDGNSAHYVVEYTGRVVQMVRESAAAGSMNPGLTRTSNDAAFTFEGESVRYGRAALDAARISADPNRFAIAIEVEGYAANGPNDKQRAALVRLIADIRRRNGPLPVLGHRDQQSYKACPGRKFPWADYGGHGVRLAGPLPVPDTGKAGDVVKSFPVPEQRTLATIRDSAWLYADSSLATNATNVRLSPSRELVYVGSFSADVRIVAYEPAAADTNSSSRAMFVRTADVTGYRTVPNATQADVEAARKAGYADAKQKAAAAVAGI